MSSFLLIFPGIKSSLMFSSFGIKPPASDFRSFSYSSLKTSQDSIDDKTQDKTPMLLVKQFSIARNTQRDSQRYIEKIRRKKELG